MLFKIGVILLFLISLVLIFFNKNKLDTYLKFEDGKTLKLWNSKFVYKPKFEDIIIENPYECSPTDLRKCSLKNGWTSCSGCKNPTAICTRYDEPMEWYKDGFENPPFIIPANDPLNRDEGYCLAMAEENRRCNRFHGKLVLATLDNKSKEYIAYCMCTNPGMIGNNKLTDACDNSFIGEVVNINVPFSKLKLKCPEGYESTTHFHTGLQKNIPICKVLLVSDVLLDPSDFKLLPKVYLNDTIKGSFTGDFFIDPSKYCLLTGEACDGEVVHFVDGKNSAVKANTNKFIPIRRNIYNRLLEGDFGPDAILKLEYDLIRVYGHLNNIMFQNVSVRLIAGEYNFAVYEKLKLDKTKNYWIDLTSHQVSFPDSFLSGHWFNGVMTVQSRYMYLKNEEPEPIPHYNVYRTRVAAMNTLNQDKSNQNFGFETNDLYRPDHVDRGNWNNLTTTSSLNQVIQANRRERSSGIMSSNPAFWDQGEAMLNPTLKRVTNQRTSLDEYLINPNIRNGTEAMETFHRFTFMEWDVVLDKIYFYEADSKENYYDFINSLIQIDLPESETRA